MGAEVNSDVREDVPRPRAPAHSGRVADPRGLALAAQVLIAVQTAAQLAVEVYGGAGTELFRQFVPLSMPLFLATVAVFLCWFRQCRLNAEHFAPGTHRHAPGFAVGSWFIPGPMWWFPRRIALDILRANSPAGGGEWLVNAWWAAWLGKTVGAAIADYLGDPRPYTYSVCEQVVSVTAAVLAVLVIRRITAGQDAKVRAGTDSPPFTRPSPR